LCVLSTRRLLVFRSLDPIIGPRALLANNRSWKKCEVQDTHTCPSCPPVASFRSMASHSTHNTHPLCPASVWDGVSVSRLHSRAVVSPDPVARKFPVGEKEAHKIGDACPIFPVVNTRGKEGGRPKRTCKCRRTSRGGTDTEDALWRTSYDDYVFCCKGVGWVGEDVRFY
jgi:hypothetical protein